MINYIKTTEVENFITAQNIATNNGFTKTNYKFISFLQQEWIKGNKVVNLDLTEGKLTIAIAIVENEQVTKGWKILKNLSDFQNFCDETRDPFEKEDKTVENISSAAALEEWEENFLFELRGY